MFRKLSKTSLFILPFLIFSARGTGTREKRFPERFLAKGKMVKWTVRVTIFSRKKDRWKTVFGKFFFRKTDLGKSFQEAEPFSRFRLLAEDSRTFLFHDWSRKFLAGKFHSHSLVAACGSAKGESVNFRGFRP